MAGKVSAPRSHRVQSTRRSHEYISGYILALLPLCRKLNAITVRVTFANKIEFFFFLILFSSLHSLYSKWPSLRSAIVSHSCTNCTALSTSNGRPGHRRDTAHDLGLMWRQKWLFEIWNSFGNIRCGESHEWLMGTPYGVCGRPVLVLVFFFLVIICMQSTRRCVISVD